MRHVHFLNRGDIGLTELNSEAIEITNGNLIQLFPSPPPLVLRLPKLLIDGEEVVDQNYSLEYHELPPMYPVELCEVPPLKCVIVGWDPLLNIPIEECYCDWSNTRLRCTPGNQLCGVSNDRICHCSDMVPPFPGCGVNFIMKWGDEDSITLIESAEAGACCAMVYGMNPDNFTDETCPSYE